MSVSRELTIVTYHYVRDLAHSRYPAIKGLDLEEFRGQLAYLRAHHNFVSMEQVVEAVQGAAPLPPKSALLTFDDGYADHFQNVFPLLHEAGIQGAFFPSAAAVVEHRLLNVNRIHFILASAMDKGMLLRKVQAAIDRDRKEFALRENEEYWREYGHASRFDPPEVAYIKRVLQAGLPETYRNRLAGSLFAEFVSVDESAFAQELYMSRAQLSLMRRCGMYIGGHGYGHYWMNELSPQQQAGEVDKCVGFLESIGSPARNWVMCYPHGSWNESLLKILAGRNCVIGLTVESGVAQLGVHSPLTLPRLDTNALPKSPTAA